MEDGGSKTEDRVESSLVKSKKNSSDCTLRFDRYSPFLYTGIEKKTVTVRSVLAMNTT